MLKTGNYIKYLSKNPFKRLLIKIFLSQIGKLTAQLNPNLILDAGCGEGFVITHINRVITDKRFKLIGVDINKEALQFSKQLLPSVSLAVGDVNKIPLKDKSVELTLCIEVLEHLKNPVYVLKEIKRVTQKYCIFSVPDEPSFSLTRLLGGKDIRRLGKTPEHVNFWNVRQFYELLQPYWEILKVKKSFPWVIVLCKIPGDKKFKMDKTKP